MTEKVNNIVDLVILEHGISILKRDTDSHFGALMNAFKTAVEDDSSIHLEIFCCQSNCEAGMTNDGIEYCGRRVTHEIDEHLTKLLESNSEKTYRLHFMGHSLGGLILRYSLAELYEKGLFNNDRLILFVCNNKEN